MGWVLFWLAVIAVLALLWFAPNLRRRARAPRAGAPGPTDPRTEQVLREAERARGQSGYGLPGGGR